MSIEIDKNSERAIQPILPDNIPKQGKYTEKDFWDRLNQWEHTFTVKQFISLKSLFQGIMPILLECPASTKYHHCYPGGLLDHIMGVVWGIEHKRVLPLPILQNALFCAYVHDLGKLGPSPSVPMYLINPDPDKRRKEPYIYNPDITQLPHEIYTLHLLQRFDIQLTPVEYQAIVYHALYYTPGTMEALRGKEDLVTLIVHQADVMDAKLNEPVFLKY